MIDLAQVGGEQLCGGQPRSVDAKETQPYKPEVAIAKHPSYRLPFKVPGSELFCFMAGNAQKQQTEHKDHQADDPADQNGNWPSRCLTTAHPPTDRPNPHPTKRLPS